MLSLSQSHLSHLDACARKYQYVFFDALLGPVTYDQHLTTQWGSQFHLLMQQQALDLPVSVLSPADVEMAHSLAALEKAAPEVFAYLPESQAFKADEDLSSQRDSGTFSQSEHRRTLEFNGYLLTVVYDLLVTSSGAPSHGNLGEASGQIFDWKTHQQPPKEAWLKKDWQTRLYPYVLCETSELTPEQISMTYWFVRVKQEKPSFYRFDYTLAQHDQTRKALQRLTDNLTQMRETANFPKVAIDQIDQGDAQGDFDPPLERICDRCPFNVRCHRDRTALPLHSTTGDREYLANSSDPTQRLKAARQLTAETVEEIPI